MKSKEIQKHIDRVVGTEGTLRIPSWWMHKILSDLVKYCKDNEGASVPIKEYVESQLNLVGKTIEDLDTRLENIESHELFEIVSELPSEPKDNTIYLIPSQNGEGNNVLTEWVYINGTWEQFGEFKADIDLSELSEKVNKLEEKKPIFEATYGVTTYDEVVDARNEGKWVIMIKDRLTYHLSYVSDSLAYFATINNNISYSAYINKATGRWVESIKTLEQTSNKTTSLSDKSTDTQYPSAKAVYDALQNVGGEKDYQLLLDTTIEEDVETFSVIDRVPNILDYKDYIILLEFKYQEGVTRPRGYISFCDANIGINAILIDKVATANYLTHYVLRVHMGKVWDKTAYIESHTNSFSNPAYDESHKGLNFFAAYPNDDTYKNTFVFNYKLYTGEKIMIYGK